MRFDEFLKKYQKCEVEVVESTLLPNNPLVTVCVQTFNHENYIRQCLDNILNQKTNFSFEILIGEDRSSDRTREICLEYAHKHPSQVRLFLHQSENKITIDGRLTGRFNFIYNLFSSSGKYIALCEGDDYWTDPNKLQKQVDFLEANDGFSLCCNRCEVRNEDSGLVTTENDQLFANGDYQFELNSFLHPFAIYTNSVVFRNKYFFDNDFDVKAFKDIYLYARLLKIGKGICLNGFMGVYRKHEGGQWSLRSKTVALTENLRTATALLSEFNQSQVQYFFRRSFIDLFNEQIRTGDTRNALETWLKSASSCTTVFGLKDTIKFGLKLAFPGIKTAS